jgi:hypothetical protein
MRRELAFQSHFALNLARMPEHLVDCIFFPLGIIREHRIEIRVALVLVEHRVRFQ